MSNHVHYLFQDRYKSEPVEDDSYFLTVLRYILQNPLKAGICHNLSEYKWSSYNEYMASENSVNGITDIKSVLKMLAQDKEEQIKQFYKYVNENNDDKCLELEENNKRITDKELCLMVETKFKITPAMINNLTDNEQIGIIKCLKQKWTDIICQQELFQVAVVIF
jgi:hypothetical protein